MNDLITFSIQQLKLRNNLTIRFSQTALDILVIKVFQHFMMKFSKILLAGAATDIVRSGHIELDTLYASNNSEVGRKPITVNLVNAPNNSTLQCGCENISCPFCNLMLSIEQTDPSVLQ